MQQPATEPAADPSEATGRPLAGWMAVAVLISWGSMAVHNLAELPISPLALENTGPLAVALLLVAAHVAWPASRVPVAALFGWALLNLVGGGIISVLPLPFLPFEPEQTVSHYLVHVVYALGQVALLALSWATLRAGTPARPTTGVAAPSTINFGRR